MNNEEKPKANRRAGKRNDPRTLLRFVEELSWLLSNYDDLDFRALGSLKEQANFSSHAPSILRTRSARRAPTAQLLVGVLPSLLTDEKIFPTNEDIVEFSGVALGIVIPRWHKKSKFELIGHIVCSTEQADPYRLDRLVSALNDLLDEKSEARKNLEEQRKSGLSWNDVIQRLLEVKE